MSDAITPEIIDRDGISVMNDGSVYVNGVLAGYAVREPVRSTDFNYFAEMEVGANGADIRGRSDSVAGEIVGNGSVLGAKETDDRDGDADAGSG